MHTFKPLVFHIPPLSTWSKGLLLAGVFLLLAGCMNMKDQPKFEPLEESQFFPDQRSSRPLPTGVVPAGPAEENTYLMSGRSESGDFVESYPFEITQAVMVRGREQYNIFCSPCHGLDGYGQGMIVQRGFSPPPSFHEARMISAPAGHYFDVITNGFGQMYAYSYRVAPADRWAIAAYIRALQYSQNATARDVPANELQKLEGQP